jgi:cell division control protein 24
LSKNVAALLGSNQLLAQRLMNLENAFDVHSIISTKQSLAPTVINDFSNDSTDAQDTNELTKGVALNNVAQLPASLEGTAISSFDFEDDLDSSRVYRRAQRDSMDFSFRSSTAPSNAWSIFSGLSLSDVSIISAVALPLSLNEIGNPQHYENGERKGAKSAPSSPHAPRAISLYQECVDVELRLSQIPGFAELFATTTNKHEDEEEDNPLFSLIQVLSRGVPLLVLLERFPEIGVIKPPARLPHMTPKLASYRFIEACIDHLGFRPDECFSVTDLMGDDTVGFIKV